MNLTGLGDRAHLFLNQRHNLDLRSRLATRTQEMATGEASDMVAHLKGDTAPLADLDHRLALAESYGAAAREAGSRLSLMQEALGQVEVTRAGLLEDLMSPLVIGDRTLAADTARAAFADIVAALNTGIRDSALFAGTASGGTALASAEAMMADIQAAVAGSASAAEVEARLDTWFDDPAGGFATMGYRGSGASITRAIDADATITLGPQADDPALRSLLKAAALGALAEEPTLPLSATDSEALLLASRDALLSLAVPITEARAGLGLAQTRVEEATARHAARSTAWGLMRNEMTQVDPYATASEIEALRTQLETHYELTSRLSSLNLVSFLR